MQLRLTKERKKKYKDENIEKWENKKKINREIKR